MSVPASPAAPAQRPTWGRTGLVATVAALVMGVAAPPGLATHDEDLHSANARLVGGLDLGGPQSDVAFWGDRAIVGFRGDTHDPADDGIRIVDISEPKAPRLAGSLTCAGSSFDVSVWEKIVVLSVNSLQSGTECDTEQGGSEPFAGLRIVSIANARKPVQLATVPLCLDDPRGPGSHNNTILPDLDRPDPRLIVYSAGWCPAVAEIPLSDPSGARLVRFLDAGPDLGCHDIVVQVARKLAWCGLHRSQLWSIEDPLNPRLVGAIENPVISQHHNVVFSADGNTMALSEERVRPGALCFGGTLSPEGALWFYDVTDPRAPILKGVHQLEQGGISGYCSAHQASLVPLRGERDVLSIAWYRGGMELIDFTQPAEPKVLAHYIAAPRDPERFTFAYSAFWYRDHVYMTNTTWESTEINEQSRRGFDVLRVSDPATADALSLGHLNAQTQEPLPAHEPTQPNSAAAGRPGAHDEPRQERGARRTCARVRTLALRLPGRRGRAPRAVRVTVDGLRVRFRRSGRRIVVDLRHLAAGRHRVVVRIRTKQGRPRMIRRIHRIC